MSKNKKSIFKGAATALITPFSDGKVDCPALSGLIEFQISQGIDALVICGTTGESSTLSDAEHRAVLEFALDKIGGRVPAIAGTGSNNTSHAVTMTKYANSLGYDGILAVTPYYNKATEQGLIKSFTEIADASSKPVILYNVPTRTCCNITLPVYQALSKHENICAVKEASGNIGAIATLLSECGDDYDVYSGDDSSTLPMLSLGGSGVISVASNIIPKEMVSLCKKWFDGDTQGCRRLHEKYLSLMNMMFCEVNPIPVKTALSLLGYCKEEFRLPMCEIGENNRVLLKKTLKAYGII